MELVFVCLSGTLDFAELINLGNLFVCLFTVESLGLSMLTISSSAN